MTKAEVIEKIGQLSQDELERCLNILIKSAIERKPALKEAITNSKHESEEIAELLADITDQSGKSALGLGENNLENIKENDNSKYTEALRTILTTLVEEDEEMSKRVEAALKQQQQLIEPVTTALVLAGIVVALSTAVDISYENEDGKKKFKIKITKPSVNESILGKFFGIFGGK